MRGTEEKEVGIDTVIEVGQGLLSGTVKGGHLGVQSAQNRDYVDYARILISEEVDIFILSKLYVCVLEVLSYVVITSKIVFCCHSSIKTLTSPYRQYNYRRKG